MSAPKWNRYSRRNFFRLPQGNRRISSILIRRFFFSTITDPARLVFEGLNSSPGCYERNFSARDLAIGAVGVIFPPIMSQCRNILTSGVIVIVFLAAATVLACLVHPLTWRAMTIWTDWDYSPDRVFRRVWMAVIILGLIVCRRPLGLRHPARVGFSVSRDGWRNLVVGIAVSLLFLAGLSLLYVGLNAWDFAAGFDYRKFWQRALRGIIRGGLVSGIEEYVFRGLIFLSICRAWDWKKAAVVTSLLFSSLHFLEGKGAVLPVQSESWMAGFWLCGHSLSNMAGHFIPFPDATGLFVVGMALCHGVWRTGSLWYGAGLHGGWIWYFTVKASFFTPTAQVAEFWTGGGRIFNGVIPILGMLLIFPVTNYLVTRGIVKTTAIHPPVR